MEKTLATARLSILPAEGSVKIEWKKGEEGTYIRAISITTQELDAVGDEMHEEFLRQGVDKGAWRKVAKAGLKRAFPMLLVREDKQKDAEEAEVVDEESV